MCKLTHGSNLSVCLPVPHEQALEVSKLLSHWLLSRGCPLDGSKSVARRRAQEAYKLVSPQLALDVCELVLERRVLVL